MDKYFQKLLVISFMGNSVFGYSKAFVVIGIFLFCSVISIIFERVVNTIFLYLFNSLFFDRHSRYSEGDQALVRFY